MSDTFSGSFPVKTSSSNLDSEMENASETNALITDTGYSTNTNTANKLSTDSSDDGCYVSGEEGLEMASERLVVGSPDNGIIGKGIEGEEKKGDPLAGSSDISMPSAEVFMKDDVEKDPKDRCLEGERVEGVGVALGKDYSVVDELGSNLVARNGAVGGLEASNGVEVTKNADLNGGFSSKNEGSWMPEEKEVEEIGSKVEGAMEDKKIEALNGGNGIAKCEEKVIIDVKKDTKVSGLGCEQIEEDGVMLGKDSSVVEKLGSHSVTGSGAVGGLECSNGVEVTENSELNEGFSSKNEGSLMQEEKEAGEIGSKGEEVMEDKKIEALNGGNGIAECVPKEIFGVTEESALSSSDTEVLKPEDSKLVGADDVKFSPEGDSVVEAMQVDLQEPAMATVAEMEEKKDVKIEAVNVPVDESVTFVDKSLNSIVHGGNADFDENSQAVRDVEAVSIDNKVQNINANADVDAATVEDTESLDMAKAYKLSETEKMEKTEKTEIMRDAECQAKQNDSMMKIAANGIKIRYGEDVSGADGDGIGSVDFGTQSTVADITTEAKPMDSDHALVSSQDDAFQGNITPHSPKSAEASQALNREVMLEAEDETENHINKEVAVRGTVSDEEADGMIFGSSEAAKQFIEELEHESGGGSQSEPKSSHDHSQRTDGQIVTDSDEEVDTDEEGEGKELFDSSVLAALLKAATGTESDGGSGGNITITSQNGSRLFSVERPAGLGSSLRSLKPAAQSSRSNLFTPSSLTSAGEPESSLTEEENKKLEKLQQIRVKFLRLVQRLGFSPDETIAAQVLYRLALVAGRQSSRLFSLDDAKMNALQLEAEGKEDLNFSVSILILGKSGVGKSATINSIFGEEKAVIDAFEPATSSVKEICGMVDGVKIRVFDTPGLKSSVLEQAFNRSVLSSIKKFTKKTPPDIVLYVDRLDAQTRDLNDLPLLRTITSSLGPSIWRSAIVTLTHAASAPPDGPSGSPLSYEVFVSQRSHVVQQCIGQAVGDLRMMSPSLMNPVSLVENHPSCRKNREGQKVLPNGQSWRPQLLLLCYSMKIISEASSLSKPQDPFDHRKLFGFRVRSPPLPYMLSSMLQSRAHPKLSSEQGGDGDSDIDLADLSDSDQEDEEDEYDQLPPFKPLKKSQIAKLSKGQRKAYFEEYDYRVKLLQKKQWKEELKRLKEMKKKGKDTAGEYGYTEEDADSGAAAPVAVPLPDMVLPPSFDGDNPAFRYRFLEPTSQFLARPVLDTHGWDHDCGYDGVNLEHSLAIASQFPAAVALQITKDKKDFSVNLDSSVSAKHGESGSSMAGFDIQSIGKQLAYIVRGETKFKNLKKNKTAAGVSVTFLGENVVTGLKIEDQIVLGKQYVLVGSAGTVRFQQDSAYGANFELQRRELDYPIGQVQSTFSLSLIKWRGDLALGFNSLVQFSVGRSSKVAVRAGINNKLSGQITVRTSSSENLSLALAGIIPTVIAVYRKFCPGASEKFSIY